MASSAESAARTPAQILFGSDSDIDDDDLSSDLHSRDSSSSEERHLLEAQITASQQEDNDRTARGSILMEPTTVPVRQFRGSILMDETLPAPGVRNSEGKKFNANTFTWETPASSSDTNSNPPPPPPQVISLSAALPLESHGAFAALFKAPDPSETTPLPFPSKVTDQPSDHPARPPEDGEPQQSEHAPDDDDENDNANNDRSSPGDEDRPSCSPDESFVPKEKSAILPVPAANVEPTTSSVKKQSSPSRKGELPKDFPRSGFLKPTRTHPIVTTTQPLKSTTSEGPLPSVPLPNRPQIKVVDRPLPPVKHEVTELEEPCPMQGESGTSAAAAVGQMIPPEARKLQVEPGEDRFTLQDGSEYVLHPHQVIGIKWLANFARRRQGCILADDMGLGKTVQAAVLLRNLCAANKLSYVLILAPKSVLEQWADHLFKLVPGLPFQTYIGSGRENRLRRLQADNDKFGVLTTYETFRSSLKDLREVPGVLRPWDIWIADEATAMKNHSTSLWKATQQIRARSRILLTGTPIMNRYDELWALADLAQPGLFGTYAEFSRTYACLLNRKAYGTDDRRDKLTKQMRDIVQPYILRRTKEEIFPEMVPSPANTDDERSCEATRGDTSPSLSQLTSCTSPTSRQVYLPRKTDIVVWQDLTPLQREIYESVRNRINYRNRSQLLFNVNYLKKLCRHPILCLPTHLQTWRHGTPQDETDADLDNLEISATKSQPQFDDDGQQKLEDADNVIESDIARIDARIDQSSTEALREACPKLLALYKLLPRLALGGHVTLVFSESTATLDLVEACVMKDLALDWRRIDGSASINKRTMAINDFNEIEEVKVMLLSTGAGCLGLNLVRADRVVILDPSWNPAKDAQAIDRAHRIGQTRPVKVFRFILGGAIEDNMLRLQLYKMNLSSSVLLGSGHKAWFTVKELHDLFSLQDCKRSRTRALLTHLTASEEQLVETLGGELQENPEECLEAQGFASMDDVIKEIEDIKARAKAARTKA